LVFEASLVALRPSSCKVKRILSYETLSESEWGQPIKFFVPNVYVDISASFEKKIAALKAYKSELIPYPHPRSLKGIRILAQKRGLEIKVGLAEAFMLIREIV